MASEIVTPRWLVYLKYVIAGAFLLLALICSAVCVIQGDYLGSANGFLLGLFSYGIYRNPVVWGGVAAFFVGLGAVVSTFYSHMYITRPEIGADTPYSSVPMMLLCHIPVYLLVAGCILLYFSPWFERSSDS